MYSQDHTYFSFWIIIYTVLFIFFLQNSAVSQPIDEVSKIIHQLENSTDPDIRIHAIENLRVFSGQGKYIIPVLSRVIENDSNKSVRIVAVNALRDYLPTDKTVVPTLIQALQSNSDNDVRKSAAKALGSIRPVDITSINALISAIKNDPVFEVRLHATKIMVSIGPISKPASMALFRVLKHDPDEKVRQLIAKTIGEVRPAYKAAIPGLIHVLKSDQNTRVREAAIVSLKRLDRKDERIIEALIFTIHNDKNFDVRETSVYSLRGMGPDKRIVPTIVHTAKNDESGTIRASALRVLVEIAPVSQEVVQTLIYALKNDKDPESRSTAARGLGKIGSVPQKIIPDLIRTSNEYSIKEACDWALKDLYLVDLSSRTEMRKLIEALANGSNTEETLQALLALENVGLANKDIIPALIYTIKSDPDEHVQEDAVQALELIGPPAIEAGPLLIKSLKKDRHSKVSIKSAEAIGELGFFSKEAVTALIDNLSYDDEGVIRSAANALEKMALESSKRKSIKMITPLKEAQKALLLAGYKKEATSVALYIEKLESIKPPWWQICLGWIQRHPFWSALIALYTIWVIIWLIIFFFRPIKLISISERLKGEFTPNWAGGLAITLRHALFVGFLYDHPRTLDAWVKNHIETVEKKFKELDTVKDRSIHITIPVEMDKKPVSDLKPANLKSVFDRPPVCLLIWGEGGAGKTSLSCQIARWAMHKDKDKRVAPHLMLPVLIEDELGADNDHAFIDAIKRQLQILTKEAQPASDDLLNHLLRRQRILVIVDHLSEMSEATRAQIKPSQSDFPANALIVTSRLKEKEKLGNLAQSTIKPLRVKGDQLSRFMTAYLEEKEKRDLFDDPEYFTACTRLSEMVADRDITVLLAKLYADQMITQKEAPIVQNIPDNIPDLMIEYVNTVNQGLKEDRLTDRDVHLAAKPLAWECLKEALKPGYIKIDTAIEVLTESGLNKEEVRARLAYLEKRLRLIQTLEPLKDRYRFVLDPLSEYLASLHLLDLSLREAPIEGSQEETNAPKEATEAFWRKFLNEADKKERDIQETKGFFLALRDCVIAKKDEFNIPNFLEDELAKRAGLDPEAIAQHRLEQRIKKLINRFTSSDPNDRRHASEELAELGKIAKQAVPALINTLESDADVKVRRSAASALGKIGLFDKRVVSVLINAWENDTHGEVRLSAEYALRSTGPGAKAAVPALINALENHANVDVREYATDSLGKIGSDAEAAVPVLIRALENDADRAILHSAVTALAKIGPGAKAAVPALINALENDANEDVRWSAASALGRIGPDAKDAIRVLINALENDENTTVRWYAAAALGGIGPGAKAAVPLLINAIETDVDRDVRRSAAYALGKIGPTDERVVPALKKALEKEKERTVRITIEAALFEIRRPNS